MVRLKEFCEFPSSARNLRISIPYGAIKSFKVDRKLSTMQIFQFLMVRLKEW